MTRHEAGYVVSVVTPAHLHAAVQSLPRNRNPDALDAGDLPQLALERCPAPAPPPPVVYPDLRPRLAARDGVRELRKLAHKQRHARTPWPVVAARVRAHLDARSADLNRRMGQLAAELAAMVPASAGAEAAALVLRSTGRGMLTSARGLVTTRTVTGAPTPERVAAAAGRAPWRRLMRRPLGGGYQCLCRYEPCSDRIELLTGFLKSASIYTRSDVL